MESESASLSPLLESGLDSTLGAAFLGNIFSAVLYGLTTMQTFTYFRSSQKDPLYFSLMVAGLWLLDTFHLVLVTHGIYYYVIDNFANPVAILSPTWSLVSQIYVTVFIIMVVRGVFTARIWILSYGNKFLAIAITLASLFVFGTGYGFASIGFGTTFEKLFEESWMLYASLGGAVLADLMIAFSLCYLLMRNRTGFKKTDSLVTSLLLYVVNTGIVTSLSAAACFVTYAIWPKDFIFMGIYFSLGKVYLNSMLLSLNVRETLLGRRTGHHISGVISTVPSFTDAPHAHSASLSVLTNTGELMTSQPYGRQDSIKEERGLP